MVKIMAFFNPEKFTNEAVEKLKTELSDKAIIAASGGVDSTVAAAVSYTHLTLPTKRIV